MRKDVNFKRDDWEIFFAFSMAAAQMDPNYNTSNVLAMEIEPFTSTKTKFWKWEDQILDDTLRTRPIRSLVTERSGKLQIDQYF